MTRQFTDLFVDLTHTVCGIEFWGPFLLKLQYTSECIVNRPTYHINFIDLYSAVRADCFDYLIDDCFLTRDEPHVI